jgi:AAA domain
MAGVIEKIRAWATSLQYWEQLALEKIVGTISLSESDYDELVLNYLQDAGLETKPARRPRLSFPSIATSEAVAAPCHLKRLFNLRDVNALPPGQELRFGPQLTVIFGDNGAGKSGYARPLGCAAFARGYREVLPNAAGNNPRAVPQADFEISFGDVNHNRTWTMGQACPDLAGFYVFDGDSLLAHLTRSNSLNFAPSELSLLTRLAEVTDGVRERLDRKIAQLNLENTLGLHFQGDTVISQKIASLDAQSDLSQLQTLARLSDQEIAQIPQLEKAILELKSQATSVQLAKRRREVADLNRLIESIGEAEQALGNRGEAEARGLLTDLGERRRETEHSGIDQFKFDAFSQIGSELWFDFILAAKALADAEAGRDAPYPQRGDHCLLCRQPLSSDALNLIERIWQFLKSDAQSRLEAAQNLCENKAREFENVNLSYFEEDSAQRRLLESELPTLVPSVESQLSALDARRREMIESLRSGDQRAASPLIGMDTGDIQRIVSIREQEIHALENSDANDRIEESERVLRELKHRQSLGEKMPEIDAYISKLRWVKRVRQSLGSTRHITMKYNELYKELVTDRYTDLFQATLKRFKTKLMVTIETRGQKGETVRQIVLSRAAFPIRLPVEKVLSDGEKTAVAVADFLTEATLDEFGSGIILDDPITSLDNNWKGVLAQCLVEYAAKRQSVVFTHDLPFLYRLTEYAEKLGVDVIAHWIREENGKPGFVYAENGPACEAAYRHANKAREFYSRAKNLPPVEQQYWLQQGFGALRSSYEALVIFELFNGVVARFEERISLDALSNVRVEAADVEEIVERAGVLSRYIDAHLHSDAFAPVKPTPCTLLEEIDAYERIRKRLKARKNIDQPKPSAQAQPAKAAPRAEKASPDS